jgi:hypothetical protein
MIDQLGGWSANNVGGRYGAGFDMEILKFIMDKIIL